jgi:predicted HicB family RNase H-like nuclease
MKALSSKGHSARNEFDGDDEIFFGRIAGIQDVVGFHADTVTDLKAAFHEAVDDYVETCKKVGKAPQKTLSGNLMLRVSPEVHSKAAMAAQLAGMSLSEWGQEAIARAIEKASA